MKALEKQLDEVFVKKAPFQLPENGKKMLVEYLPWINLVGGAFTLLSAYWLWHWAHAVNNLVNYVNDLSRAFGGTSVIETSRFSVVVWLGIIVLAVEGVLYLAAFPGTRDKKKAGWNLLFYGLLLNIVYGVVIAFSKYGGFGSLLGSLVSSVVGLYLLFQIRSRYI